MSKINEAFKGISFADIWSGRLLNMTSKRKSQAESKVDMDG